MENSRKQQLYREQWGTWLLNMLSHERLVRNQMCTALETSSNNEVNMVEWVWELYGKEKVIEAADPKLCGNFDKKKMEYSMIVGLWCAYPDYNMRLSIQPAIQVLVFEVPLPLLPSKMPVPRYLADESPPKSFQILSRDHFSASEAEGGEIERNSSSRKQEESCITSVSVNQVTITILEGR